MIGDGVTGTYAGVCDGRRSNAQVPACSLTPTDDLRLSPLTSRRRELILSVFRRCYRWAWLEFRLMMRP